MHRRFGVWRCSVVFLIGDRRRPASSGGGAACRRRACRHDPRGTAAARAGMRKRRRAVFAGVARRRQGQPQFPGAHAPRPLRGAAQRERGSGSRSRSQPRAAAARGRGQRRHRAACHLRLPRPFLPDHRLPRRPRLDAALLHAHARPALARARACASLHAVPVSTEFLEDGALRSHGGGASLRRADRARRAGGRHAHRRLVRRAAKRRCSARARHNATPASCTWTCTMETC